MIFFKIIKMESHCIQCSCTFLNSFRRARHERKVHGDRIYKCNECPSAFCTQSGLTRHINKGHKVYKCTACLYSCKSKRELINHKNKCDVCLEKNICNQKNNMNVTHVSLNLLINLAL
jgi:hypothetical protein